MFKIDSRPTFRRSVTVLVPDADGSRKETMQATFRALPLDEVNRFNLATEGGTTDFLCAAIVRLDELENASGALLDWSDTIRDLVLQLPYARLALLQTYFGEVSKASEGN